MRILYFITGLRLGGAEKQLLLLAQQMQMAGNKVKVAVMESDGVMVGDFENAGIEVIGLGVRGWATLPSAYKRFKRVIDYFEPEIVHSHMIHANAFAAFNKLLNPKFKLVCTAHNINEGSKAVMSTYYLAKIAANWTTNVSKEAFDFFIQKKYFNPQKSSFVPNAIDTASFSPEKYDRLQVRTRLGVDQDTFVFLSAGRLHFQKNYPLLLQAFAMVRNKIPLAQLYIAGEGPDVGQLQALCTELNLKNNVFLLGRRDDIPALMAASDCFVLSSRFEGFGLVIAEAMAMGLPVISTDCGGVKEVMGGHGNLVTVDDAEGFSNAMLAVMQIPQVAKGARHHIEQNYGVMTVMDQWTKIYNSL